jgi:hypothetical protein
VVTANEEYSDLMIGHQIGVIRYGGGVFRDLIPILEKSQNAQEKLLLEKITAIEAAGGVYDLQSERRLNRLVKAWRELREGDFDKFSDGLQKEMEKLALYEIDYQKEAISKVIPFSVAMASVDPERMAAAISSLTFPANLPEIQRKNLVSWTRSMEDAEVRRVLTSIATGFATGKTSQEIVKNIMSTGTRLTRAHAETIVRTTTAATAQEARNQFFALNTDISKEDVWTAVLDGRTTLICFGRDGKIRKRGYWQARYPAHMGERSTIIAVLDGVGIIGNRPTIMDTRTRRQREIDFRFDVKTRLGTARWQKMTSTQRQDAIRRERQAWAKTVIGNSPAEINMDTWLKKQPDAYQREYLGDTRYQLYKKGGLKAGNFADSSGNVYTLQQLAKRDRQAFIDAGLDPDQF